MCERPVRSNSELLEIRWHRIIIVCFACLAPAPSPIVLADAPPSALLALALSPIVLADAPPAALHTCAPSPFVLADAPPSALLALALSPIVLADALSPAIPTPPVLLPIVLADAPPAALPASAPLPIVLTLPRLPSSCLLRLFAASSLVSVCSRPLPATHSTLLIRCPAAVCATAATRLASPTPSAAALPADASLC